MRAAILVTLTTLATALFLTATAQAQTTWYVDDDCTPPGTGIPGDPFCTIQDGINAAVSGVDEVVVAPGTYNEIIDFGGKAITVRSSGGASVTTIDATGVADPGDGLPVVRCDNGETATTVLDGFTITEGTGDTSLGGTDEPRGGGMFNNGSSPTVTNCVFTGNTALAVGPAGSPGGGGMYNNNSSPTVTNCTFIGNTARNGGGMYNDSNSSPTVTECFFDGNSGVQTGGGISNSTSGSPTVSNCTFIGNSGGSGGGGMYNITGGPTVTDCLFDGNSAYSGGGVYNTNAKSTVTNCTFIGNAATALGGGGGMYLSGLAPTVANCTFSGNTSTADYGGGAILNVAYSDPTVTNCTFSGNTTTFNGGGITNVFASDPTMTNCIFWENSDSGGMDESAQIHNDDSILVNSPVVNYSNVQGGWTGIGGNNINANPLFVDADGTDNAVGTADDNLHLASGSPCIDAADNTAVPPDELDLDADGDTDEFLPFDLDGSPRFADDRDVPDTGIGECRIVDMGAYERLMGLDSDGDEIDDGVDNCPDDPNGDQQDTDQDCVGDACDVCPDVISPGGVHGSCCPSDWGRPLGDLDKDCDVDLSDFGLFALNYTGAQ